ncbi:MAG: VacB/RNase II family 3'-5' exoribonuclease [Planctomycetota bacterium]|nr:MAG: VacB/RNase II family 3'-5' exoribonuclease [Planctomycetota bacterium]
MPLRFKDRILRRLADADADDARAIDDLARDLGVAPEDAPAFREAVRQLESAGQVVVYDDEAVALPPMGDEVVGVFKKNPRGFGFVIPTNPHAHGDLFVPPGATGDALTGDTVRAAVRRRRGRGGQRELVGEIVEVVQRKHTSFTGELRQQGGRWLVFPDGEALTEPVLVGDPGAKNARAGDKVVFELLHMPEDGMLGEGVITRVLGAAGEPDVETQATIAAYNLPGDFPDACLEQARGVSARFEEEVDRAERAGGFANREDLRDAFVITIDPPDARDFDDALSLEILPDGKGRPRFKLGVHIADVSHFVTPGSPLDEEARARGNSCYLPRRVIPMLPEILSNGVCSLQEGVPRFCKSAFIAYDERGEVAGRGFSSTVIKSAKRLTYLEAQALIDGDTAEAKKHARTEPDYSDRLLETLRQFNRLSKLIYERRRRRGMIHLDLPEVELIFDDDGRVIDAEPEDDAWTHRLIEMFMVEANESVAQLFERLGVALLRRIHPEPEPSSFESLRKFLRPIGFSLPKEPDRFDLQRLLDATAGKPAAPAVHFAVLRSLTKALYSPALIGHYALASDAYAHFTSPIRRYPDLTVHRALAAYLSRTGNGADPPRDDARMRSLGKTLARDPLCPDEDALARIGGDCNRTEENASNAEDDLRNYLVMQLLSEKIGEVFPGVVTGVIPKGVFVRIEKYLVEGLVKAEDLPVPGRGVGGRWRIDDKTGALVEQSTGRSYRLGDRVRVAVSSVNLPARQMELLIPSEEAAKRAGVGKALTLGSAGGGLGHADGAGFKTKSGTQRRSQKSRSRDKRKKDHRADRKGKGKRQ